MVGVGAGFAVLFLALGYLGMQALDRSSQTILEERRARALMLAGELDRFLEQAFYELEKATTFAPFDPTARNLEAEMHMLAHAYGRLGSFSLGVSFLDRSGRIVLTEPFRHEAMGTDLSGMPHIEQALRTGERTVSAPHRDLRLGKPAVALTVPVKDASGRVVALLSGLVDLVDSPFGQALSSAKGQGRTAHADVVTADGTVVASTDLEHVLHPAEHPDFYAGAFARGTVVETAPYVEDGQVVDHHVMAFALLSEAPWGLGIGASETETFVHVDDFRRLLVATALLFFLAVSSLTLAGAQILVRPVVALTQAAGRMARGDLSQVVSVPEGGEIGLLASSLETMRRRLAASLADFAQLNSSLEERVRLRTDELGKRTKELEATAAIAETVSASLNLEQVLESGLDGVLRAVQADCAAIWLTDPESGGLRLRVHKNLPAEFIAAERELACGECLCGLVVDRGEPLVVPELAGYPVAMREACRHAGLSRLALVPLAAKGTVHGVFMLGAKAGAFSPEEVRMVTAVGHHLSLAVENARLYQDIQQKEVHLRRLLERVIGAQEAERKRIARELHDETAQALTALVLSLDGTVDSLPSGQERLKAQLMQVREMLGGSLAEIRKIILDLRPTALDDLGLVAALRRYAEARLGPGRVHVEVNATGYEDGLWPEKEVTLFRIGQEALNNVAAHAAATRVLIELGRSGDQVELSVTDNGKGFDWREVEHSADPMRGLGLMGMRERAALFGARCEIESQPGKGTRVRVLVPLAGNEVLEEIAERR